MRNASGFSATIESSADSCWCSAPGALHVAIIGSTYKLVSEFDQTLLKMGPADIDDFGAMCQRIEEQRYDGHGPVGSISTQQQDRWTAILRCDA